MLAQQKHIVFPAQRAVFETSLKRPRGTFNI